MTRHAILLAVGALFAVLGTTVLAVLLRVQTGGGLGDEGGMRAVLLVPAAVAVVGVVLVVIGARGLVRRRERRAMPLAAVRAEPTAAGRWELDDVASGIARRLVGSPCSVHQAGERIEIRWAGDAAQERCELRDAGDGALSHTDVVESAVEVLRLHGGRTLRAGPSRRGGMRGVVHGATSGATSGGFDTVDRRAVHAAIDETLARAGWRREG
ncbi:hypothetical protein [Agrococcus baldri]|uniref:hypothetical protein n=1 Tax=Agrococcus baldri TaxID=153730 RepID=UPI0011BE6B10|nr:hypothetical protein [Agrococcus baldri]